VDLSPWVENKPFDLTVIITKFKESITFIISIKSTNFIIAKWEKDLMQAIMKSARNFEVQFI